MTWASLCLRVQAVVWVTPRRRPSSMLEMPCLLCVTWYMARNQVRSGTLVAAKMVPAGRRGLPAAGRALEEAAGPDHAVVPSPPLPADETLGPAPGGQGRFQWSSPHPLWRGGA